MVALFFLSEDFLNGVFHSEIDQIKRHHERSFRIEYELALANC